MYTHEVSTISSRDPVARRRAIVAAAADLIVEIGITHLTHRRVAARAGVPLGSTTHYFASLDDLRGEALHILGDRIDADLSALRETLADCQDVPATLARWCTSYFQDRTRMHTETAFYVAGVEHPELRPLTRRWFDGIVAALGTRTDAAAARSIALYLDGALLHATLQDTPVGEDELAEAIARLAGGSR